PAPSNMAATAVSGTRVDLSWTDNSTNESGFKLYRSTDNVTWLFFAQTGENVTSYTWWAGSPGTTYSFRAVSYNAGGDSVPSNAATVTTPSAPAAPGNLSATAVSGTRVDLAWTDNSADESGFHLYRSTDGVNWTFFAATGANVATYSWLAAAPNTSYSFRVTSYNAAGDSAPSNVATATTPSGPSVPDAPSNLTATAVSGGRIDLAWTDNSNSETEFRVYRSTDGVNWTWFASAAADATAYTWWGASPGTTYSFRVTAANAAGESAPSNVATATTPTAPAAPSSLTADAVSGSQINLAWTPNS